MEPKYAREASPRRPAGMPLSTIVLLCVLALVAARAYAAEAAPANPSSSAVTVEGTVPGSLRPGVTTPMNLTIENPSSHDLHVGRIVLTKIRVDRAHSSCSVSLTGGGANFRMPPVEVDRSYPPGRSAAPTGSLTMIDAGVGQDACRGATLTLTLRAS